MSTSIHFVESTTVSVHRDGATATATLSWVLDVELLLLAPGLLLLRRPPGGSSRREDVGSNTSESRSSSKPGVSTGRARVSRRRAALDASAVRVRIVRTVVVLRHFWGPVGRRSDTLHRLIVVGVDCGARVGKVNGSVVLCAARVELRR